MMHAVCKNCGNRVPIFADQHHPLDEMLFDKTKGGYICRSCGCLMVKSNSVFTKGGHIVHAKTKG